ncbi:MAG: HypC/HybG/HupF family hydrogenase formation chaperone [Selenomonadales bacterium]|jgi:hydrogenase expression/formation protein HypC|nr:HypC/HybG/HupF family hydrogenase formation chaperone [Selenomonadales bacterium]MDY3740105.1 HypC/HybG/HupF family hydrogenase formation chaperone [Selenomonadaceae bacterium]MEE1362733.1 HypC/HybG/HupF family hydrogenase formation chaperone [Selenomonadaceae bacterium]
MCLAVPAKVIAIKDMMATVDLNGVQRDVSTMLLPEAEVGQFVLVHAGFAMQVVSQEDAEVTNALLAEMKGGERTVEHL